MANLTVSAVLDAAPDRMWADVRNISSHTEWMNDAVAIRFTSQSTEGVGTTFDCDTKVGPIRLTDRMEVTEWVDASTMGVRHVGLVTGTGAFTLTPLPFDRTRFTWAEELEFPWWMGGRLGARMAVPVLSHVWRRSMANLTARFAH